MRKKRSTGKTRATTSRKATVPRPDSSAATVAAPQAVLDLVERFERNRDQYRSTGYNETQLRREFIDPFFKALGWDVDNEQGYAEPYKDVVHEDSLRIEGAAKAPDYCFRIGGARKFFVETKKPAINLKNDPAPAFQLRRYAWSAKLPLSILTDFEELAVYDCRVKPTKSDQPSAARILYLTFDQYPERWSDIAGIFSQKAVLQGAFDRFAESKRAKRGTAEVDDAFLAEIESWREALARNLALRNPNLTQRELNHAVQLTIDRIVFLRICEDRGIEDQARLAELLRGDDVYPRLFELFQAADDRYNSGLFYFRREHGRGEPDALTPGLAIDDKTLKDIIKRLYYPESPYEFSVLPADILGQVYERFLGKVIRLTKGHRAVVEEKPEVRKAGGVYYTPTYIVDYIVEHTVGTLLDGAEVRWIGREKGRDVHKPRLDRTLRVLDPACGSGSFLLGAYQRLLDWHLSWYTAHEPESWARKKNPPIYRKTRPGGERDDAHAANGSTRASDWRLTVAERKRILVEHIYGVDIDPQAVEVTKLSLLLKVLEGESSDSLGSHLWYEKERALPDLSNNIKCGNSLIGPDFYEGRQIDMFDEETRYRINAFDWRAEFPSILADGGFDAVIGNPPYIRLQTMRETAPETIEYYKSNYEAAAKGNYDIYVLFAERGLKLLDPSGCLGFILPHKFFNAKYGQPLRSILAEGRNIAQVVHFTDQQVFRGATTYTCLLFLCKSPSDNVRYIKVADLERWRFAEDGEEANVSSTHFTASEWNITIGPHAALFERLSAMTVMLGDIAALFVGLQTDADDVFILEEIRRDGRRVLCASTSTGDEHWFEDDHLKQLLKGSLNICRYYLRDVTKRLIFPYTTLNGKSSIIDIEAYRRSYPLTWAYLERNKSRLVSRNRGRMGQQWYGYVYRKNHLRFEQPKLVVPSLATGSCFAADLAGQYYFVGSGGGGGGGYGIIPTGFENPIYILGVVNSSLASAYLRSISTVFRGGYIALNRQYIERIPIRTIDFDNADDKRRHDRMVSLVQRMLDLHKRLAGAKTAHERNVLQRDIDHTDREIDRLVYELYGLTEDEIRIVEEATA